MNLRSAKQSTVVTPAQAGGHPNHHLSADRWLGQIPAFARMTFVVNREVLS